MVVSLHMGLRHVLFANWSIDAGIVEAHLPDGVTIDTFDDRAWLTMLAFTNVDVRPRRFPAGIGVRFPQLNFRTYVTHRGTPGVYFFSLDASAIAAVIGARLFNRLPYYHATIDLVEEHGTVRFTSRRRHPGARPAHVRATYESTGDQLQATAGTLAHFIAERYRYVTEDGSGSLRSGTIGHEPWPLQEARTEIDANGLFAANGFALPDAEPHCFYSPGVSVIAPGRPPVE